MTDQIVVVKKSGISPSASRINSLLWLYLLVPIPMLTEFIEFGRQPDSFRGWVTEITAGLCIAMLVRKVRKDHLAVQRLSRTDALTGLSNRRVFDEAIQDECARVNRSRKSLSLVYLDLDKFKQLNDSAGHEAGDRALKQLAFAIGNVVRMRIDWGFRIGGDEFALLLPDSSMVQAEAIVERIRQQCALSDPMWANGQLGISAGIVELQANETTNEFIRRADNAMYHQKQLRRATQNSPTR